MKNTNKNLVMTVDDEKNFESSNKCWICNKFYTEGDNKARDHDHVIGVQHIKTVILVLG